MSIAELEQGHHWIWKEAYKISSIYDRLSHSRCFLRYAILANIGYRMYGYNLEKYGNDYMTRDHLLAGAEITL